MAKEAMSDVLFERLLATINQQTNSSDSKLEILFETRGYYSALQACRLLYAFSAPPDKVRAIEILEPRLCRMTCSEARDVIGACSIHNDKLKVLHCIKRYLVDNATREGVEQILSAFPFEHDKQHALAILHTVRSDAADAMSAGGHQGYAALGGLHTQSRPLVPHLYGPTEQQYLKAAGRGEIQIPAHAKHGLIPSMYTGHPTYAYPPGRDYATENRYPGNAVYNDNQGKPATDMCYPSGAPPLHMHQGGPQATGFSEQ